MDSSRPPRCGSADIDLLATHGGHVVHCPVSNMKLGSGIAPVPALLARGIEPQRAAAAAVRLHARAGLRAAARLGVDGVLARAVVAACPEGAILAVGFMLLDVLGPAGPATFLYFKF